MKSIINAFTCQSCAKESWPIVLCASCVLSQYSRPWGPGPPGWKWVSAGCPGSEAHTRSCVRWLGPSSLTCTSVAARAYFLSKQWSQLDQRISNTLTIQLKYENIIWVEVGVVSIKVYRLGRSRCKLNAKKLQLMITSLSEQLHVYKILKKINGLATLTELTLSILMPLPWNLLINLTIHFYIFIFGNIFICSVSRVRRYDGQNLDIFRFYSLIR